MPRLRLLRGLLVEQRDRTAAMVTAIDRELEARAMGIRTTPEDQLRMFAYLEEHVRRAVSVWTRVGPQAEQRAVSALRADLSSGRWAERNRDLVALDAAELGLRLLVA